MCKPHRALRLKAFDFGDLLGRKRTSGLAKPTADAVQSAGSQQQSLVGQVRPVREYDRLPSIACRLRASMRVEDAS